MIGGNTILGLNSKNVTTDGIGVDSYTLTHITDINGWLDLITETKPYAKFSAPIKQSSHVFIADYKEIELAGSSDLVAVIENEEYDVTYIDDPMGLHQHIEIYLRKVV